MRFLVLIILPILCCKVSLLAQYQFKNLNVDHGLSQNSVTSISQDSTGSIWFATQDGLNRYSGNFEIFDKYFDDVTRPGYNILGDIYTDREGKLWIITQGGMLEYFSQDENQFFKIDHLNEVRDIIQDKDFNHWILRSESAITTFRSDSILWSKDLNCQCRINRLQIIDDKLFALSNKGLFEIEKDGDIEKSYQQLNISSLEIDDEGFRWIGTFGNGLWLHQSNSNKLVKFNGVPNDLVVYDLLNDSSGRLWIASYGDGLYMIEDEEVYHFEPSENNNSSISYHDILDIFEDRSGAIWFSTDGRGVDIFDQYLQKFNVVNNDILEDKAEVDVVRSIFVDEEYLLAGTSGKGLTIHRKDEKSWKTFTTNDGLSSDRIMSIAKIDDLYLAGTQGAGVDIFTIEKNQIRPHRNILRGMTVWNMCPMSSGKIWIATRQNGLILLGQNFEIELQRFVPITEGVASIRKLICSENRVWVATDEHGLYSYIPSSNTWTNHSDSKFGNKIKSINLQNDKLLIGSNGDGLLVYDIENDQWATLADRKSGLSNNVVYGAFKQDESIWVSSNRGISRLVVGDDFKVESIRNFDKADGLQSYEFNTGAYFQDENNLIYFGGIEGLNWFDPKKVPSSPFQPTPFISSFQAGGQTLNHHQLDNYSLDADQNSFTIEFASDMLSSADYAMFAYRLDGFETEWTYTNDTKAEYMNIPAGEYSFQLKAGNYDELWNEQILEQTIEVKQKWFLKKWVQALFLIALAAIGGWLIWSRKKQLAYEKQIEQDEVERKMLINLNKSKAEMYSNITHELKTPLTIISGVTKQLDIDPSKKNLILRNSDNMLDLVDRMLILSKAESEVMPLKKEKIELVSFTEGLVNYFQPLATEKSIELNFHNEISSLLVLQDSEKYKFVVNNLLSNAIKYTPNGGKVLLTLGTANDRIKLEVKDTGIGIIEDEKEKIFERFYQSKSAAGQGTGVGLTIVKQFVDIMKGEIKVDSTIHKGAAFTIYLPFEYPTESVVSQKMPELIAVKEKCVLIVEDNQDMLAYMRSIFSKTYTVIESQTIEYGLELASNHLPDIVLCDLKLPDGNGLDLIEKIAKNPKTDHIPIIVVSANTSSSTKMDALNAGADVFMAKPFNEAELQLRVKKLLYKNPISGNAKSGNDENMSSVAENEFMDKIILCIRQNMTNPEFGLQHLCKAVYLERTQVYRKIKHFTNLSPSQLIRSMRMDHAVNQIKRGEKNIERLASNCGYSDPKYFSKVFQGQFGVSVQKYSSKY